jgi:hypothetical protein
LNRVYWCNATKAVNFYHPPARIGCVTCRWNNIQQISFVYLNNIINIIYKTIIKTKKGCVPKDKPRSPIWKSATAIAWSATLGTKVNWGSSYAEERLCSGSSLSSSWSLINPPLEVKSSRSFSTWSLIFSLRTNVDIFRCGRTTDGESKHLNYLKGHGSKKRCVRINSNNMILYF